MILIYIGLFFLLLLLGCPVLIAMGGSATLWAAFQNMPDIVVAMKIFTQTDNFAFMAVPFFMLAGQLMDKTGITECIVDFSQSLVGHIRGGFGCTVVLAGIIMAGISGSAYADAAAIGALTLKGLRDSGYDEGMSCAIVCSAGSLGPIIPPSILMIIFATISGMNVASLFAAGILPGIVIGVGYMIICILYAKRHDIPTNRFPGFFNIWRSFKVAVWAILMPLIIIGGILSGVFTPTEAGVIAVLYGIGYGLVRRKMTATAMIKALQEATVNSAGPVGIVAFSAIFGYMLSREKVPRIVFEFFTDYVHYPIVFLFMIILISLIAGCFIDPSATMIMLVPILMPVAIQLGIDPLHFSIIFCVALLTAGLTPPVGGILFVVAAINNTPLTQMVRPILPFIGIMLFVCVLMVFIPGIGTLIPSLIIR